DSKAIREVIRLDHPINFQPGFALSPDEHEVAYVAYQGRQHDVWRADLRGGKPQRITNDAAVEQNPFWESDDTLIYNSTTDGKVRIYRVALSGGEPVPIATGDNYCYISDFSIKANRLLCYEQEDESDIYAVDVKTGRERQITENLGAEFWSSISPDGETILFQAIRGKKFVWEPRKSLLLTK